ncbi:hypothetical protein EI555_010407, partial [Monodon monoceros]
MLTGLFLAIHYTPDTATAFLSVAHIYRDVKYRNMKHRNYSTTFSYSYYIYRLCTTMRTNVILRGNMLAAVHLLFLHETGPNNPTGIPSDTDKIPFHPYHTIRHPRHSTTNPSLILVLSLPDLLGDPDNYTSAKPLNTSLHIKPDYPSPNNALANSSKAIPISVEQNVTTLRCSGQTRLDPLQGSPDSCANNWKL